MPPGKKLTEKQKLFIIHYLKHFNATTAAKAAGFSSKNHAKYGSDLLHKPEIQTEIKRSIGVQNKKHNFNWDRRKDNGKTASAAKYSMELAAYPMDDPGVPPDILGRPITVKD